MGLPGGSSGVGEELAFSASARLIQVTPRKLICVSTSKGCYAVVVTSKRTELRAVRLKRIRGLVSRRLNSTKGVFVHVNGDLVVGVSCLCDVGIARRALVLSSGGSFGFAMGTSGSDLGRLGSTVRETG